MRRLALISLLALVVGCAWTMSPDRRRRISDCLARCGGPEQTPARGPLDPQGGIRDTRTDCERRCHALR